MANALFDIHRNNVSGDATFVFVDYKNVGVNIKAMFIDEGTDLPNITTDQDIADILSGARIPAIASCPILATKTVGAVAVGVADADDVTFTALSGASAESLILFKDTGTEATSILLAYWNTATGLPLTPNGGDVTVQWSASGIYRY